MQHDRGERAQNVMWEDSHFLKSEIVRVYAAHVGVSKTRWHAIKESDAGEKNAAEMMKVKLVDVLPIEASDSTVKEYFVTDAWNDYASIARRPVSHRDVIPLQTNIRDVIKGFTQEDRPFYFLTSENRVVGLVTVADLNSREVKVYLYALLSELEVRLGFFLADQLSEEALFRLTIETSEKNKHIDVRERYLADKANGVDVAVVQYLYLPDLISAVATADLHGILGYRSKKSFRDSFDSVIELRNQVAHPNHSIVTSKTGVSKLWERVDRIEEALFRLR
jgi:hypothetical protein